MVSFGKRAVWLVIVSVGTSHLLVASENESRFVAFSLREASRLAKARQSSPALDTLGGITRVGAFVYDSHDKDLILIGLVAPTLPGGRLDDLVGALRARIVYKEFPLVSIDLTKETPRTRLQDVVFQGGLQDTLLGDDFLNCDIFLKHYSLELDRFQRVSGVPSYRSLIEAVVRADIEQKGARILNFEWRPGNAGTEYDKMALSNAFVYQARFWYKIRQPYEAFCRPSLERPEVFRIDEVALIVESQCVLGAETEGNRKCRESFADGWTRRFPEMCQMYPVLRKLKMIYDLTAVADAVAQLQQQEDLPFLAYFLREYRRVPCRTPRQYPLKEMTGVATRNDGATELIYVSGGVELRPEREVVKDLNAGSVYGFRDLILKTRPSPDALTWELPLAGWRMPNGRDLFDVSKPKTSGQSFPLASDKAQPLPGCYIFAQSVTLRPSTGSQAGRTGEVFRGFSLSQALTVGLPRNLPTYKWNGVFVDPNLVRNTKPLPPGVREKTENAFKTGEGPTQPGKLGLKKEKQKAP